MGIATTAPIADGLRRAKDRLLDERLAPTGVVTDVVARSWERSRAIGLRPSDRLLFQPVAGLGDTHDLFERAQRLIAAVKPELEHVASTLARPNLVALCTDSSGVLVHSVHHGTTVASEMRELLRLGRNIGEKVLGTTAPGCVIEEERALTIAGEEHFLSEVACFACAAAPVFAFDGRLAGVLDLTGLEPVIEDLAFDLIKIASRAAEQHLFAAEAPGLLLRVQYDPRFLATPLRSMLAVGDDGRIVGACTAARQTFGIGRGTAPALDTIVDADRETLERRLHESEVIELHTHRGGRLFASLERTAPPSLPPATLERVTHELVRQTLAAHHGNVSAAARALGISRGTLYKKARRRS